MGQIKHNNPDFNGYLKVWTNLAPVFCNLFNKQKGKNKKAIM